MDRIPWADKEVERMKVMVDAKATMDDLLAVLKERSKTSIMQKLRGLGLKIYMPDPEIDEAAFKRFLKERQLREV